nr:hypothetical protein [Tanacetum cinerariifolium]
SSTKNLVPIPRECEVTLENGSESIVPVKDDSSFLTTFSNPLLDDDDKINSDELNSHIESNYVESTSNHDSVKFDNLDEFFGPLIPIHIAEEERIMREHADYINRMEMLFTINLRPRPTVNANTNVEFIPSLPIPVQDNESQREEIDIVTETNDVRSYFPPANTIPRHSRRKSTSIVESKIQTNATMADNHTMVQMLQAPIEGYEDAHSVKPIHRKARPT